MIALYPVRPGDSNDELVMSLRSLTNLPEVDEVWTIGHRPAWCRPDRHIDGNHHDTGPANVYNNVRHGTRAAAQAGHRQVLVMNDDFIITEPVDRVPNLYRSTLAEHLDLPRMKQGRGQWWPTSLQTTRLCLQAHGVADPTSWELHTPFRCQPARMADTLDMLQHVTPNNPPQWRSLYGNLAKMTGTQGQDGKAYRPGDTIAAPFFSTQDSSYPYFAAQLQRMFPTPSRWETP